MYKINETVIYGTDGICTVADIAERNFGGCSEIYYILKPLYKSGSTIMVPKSNPTLVSRLRKVLTPEQANALIESIPAQKSAEWIENEKVRKETYRSLIMKGDRVELIRFIKRLYERGEAQRELGKKLYACDERFLEDAQRMLHDELSVVLGISREDILSYIISTAGLDEKNA